MKTFAICSEWSIRLKPNCLPQFSYPKISVVKRFRKKKRSGEELIRDRATTPMVLGTIVCNSLPNGDSEWGCPLMKIAGVFFQQRQGNMFEGGCVGGSQYHYGCGPGLIGFLPAQRAQTPAVSGLETGKAKLWAGRAQIVALRLGEGQKFFGDLSTYGM